ncbi:DUF1800 domain-containing protein [Leeia sp. TBRC 13508]|uniref:DUF1800 domain-containing protein n=1 Tax=Leeia speluncae TaxID=2884804 RepID=A0ABS8D3A2_9NEIS|nr:DUF1800 domain-containing protein [Leeia speluncae]MCB6182488.1 DUF1800 domain-containing protein [Leeia speluncae]
MLSHQRFRTKQKTQLLIGFFLTFKSICVFAAPLGFEDAKHLLSRTGFGSPTYAEIQSIAKLEKETAVDTLLNANQADNFPPPSSDVLAFVSKSDIKDLSEQDKRALAAKVRGNARSLQAWWMERMIETPNPLTENMTLFWHGHFTSGVDKVKEPRLMYAQNELLRKASLGNFAALLHAIAKDPAMLEYLDGARSKKNKPNENFARELLELYTMGEGHYTESDIQNLAKAFTGWTIDRETGEFVENPKQMNRDEKTIFGQQGNWSGDEAIDLILSKPETASWITSRLWQHFISTKLDDKTRNQLAKSFASNYEIKPLVRSILLSPAFWAKDNRGTQIKSPIDLAVSTIRLCPPESVNYEQLVNTTASWGEKLMEPPNVKGWPGGNTWINSNTLTLRNQWLQTYAAGKKDKTHSKVSVKSCLNLLPKDLPLTTAYLSLAESSNQPVITNFADLFSQPAFQLK